MTTAELIAENVMAGCTVTSLGIHKPPEGYVIFLNYDRTHHFWACVDGRESLEHWDRWAVYRGAVDDAKRKQEAAK